MKTLDAAIDYAHMIVPMIDESDTKEMWRSIEYYLTAHKKIQPVIEKIALGRIEDVIDTIDNSPLTWDELKTMEGKPVWVEYSGYTPNWEIIENIGAVRGSTGDFTGNFIETNKTVLHKDKQGKTWQTYRKERG